MKLITNSSEAKSMEVLESTRKNYEQSKKMRLTETFYAVETKDMSGVNGGQCPIAFRGDDRHPNMRVQNVPPVFETGFSSKALREMHRVLRTDVLRVRSGGVGVYKNEMEFMFARDKGPVYRAQVGDMYFRPS